MVILWLGFNFMAFIVMIFCRNRFGPNNLVLYQCISLVIANENTLYLQYRILFLEFQAILQLVR